MTDKPATFSSLTVHDIRVAWLEPAAESGSGADAAAYLTLQVSANTNGAWEACRGGTAVTQVPTITGPRSRRAILLRVAADLLAARRTGCGAAVLAHLPQITAAAAPVQLRRLDAVEALELEMAENAAGQDLRDCACRYALVERGQQQYAPDLSITTHERVADAFAENAKHEHPEHWAPETLVDLDTGQRWRLSKTFGVTYVVAAQAIR